MFKLEHSTEDIDKSKKAAPILVKLHDKQDSKWNDDFAANSLLRQQHRVRFRIIFNFVFPCIKRTLSLIYYFCCWLISNFLLI